MKRDAIKQYQDKYASFYVPIERRKDLQEKKISLILWNLQD
jgi:hypothetical protein